MQIRDDRERSRRQSGIAASGGEHSRALESDILIRLATLETYYPGIVGGRVLIERGERHHETGNRYHVRLDLTVPGADIVISREASLHGVVRDRHAGKASKSIDPVGPRKHAVVTIHEASISPVEVARLREWIFTCGRGSTRGSPQRERLSDPRRRARRGKAEGQRLAESRNGQRKSVTSLLAIAQNRLAGSAVVTTDEGAQLFKIYCASCHGEAGTGHGPAAASFRHPPPDLTELACTNGGKFLADHVRRIVEGQDVEAHGDRDMPMWGDAFRMTSKERSAEMDRFSRKPLAPVISPVERALISLGLGATEAA